MLGQKGSIASGKYIRLITSCREEINHILFDKLFTLIIAIYISRSVYTLDIH